MSPLGAYLRKLRISRKLSRASVASKLGISIEDYLMLEAYPENVPGIELGFLIEALNLNSEEYAELMFLAQQMIQDKLSEQSPNGRLLVLPNNSKKY